MLAAVKVIQAACWPLGVLVPSRPEVIQMPYQAISTSVQVKQVSQE